MATLEVLEGYSNVIRAIFPCTQILLVLVNNWGSTGGTDEMLGWSNTKPNSVHESYFSDSGSMDIYKQRATAILGRVNVYNGRR